MIRWKHGLVFLTQMGPLKKSLLLSSLFDKQGVWQTGSGTRSRLTCSQNAVKEPKRLTQVKNGIPRTQSQAGLPIGNLVIWKSHVKRGLKIQEHSSEIRKPESRVWHRESWCSGFYGMLKTLLGEKRIPRLPEPNFVAGSVLVWRLLWRCGKVPCHWLTLSRAGTWKSRRGRGGF